MAHTVFVAVVVVGAVYLGVRTWQGHRVQEKIAAHLGIPGRWFRLGFVVGSTRYKGYDVKLHGQPDIWQEFVWKRQRRLMINVVGSGIKKNTAAIKEELPNWPEIEKAEISGSSVELIYKPAWFGGDSWLWNPRRDWRVVEVIDRIIDLAGSC